MRVPTCKVESGANRAMMLDDAVLCDRMPDNRRRFWNESIWPQDSRHGFFGAEDRTNSEGEGSIWLQGGGPVWVGTPRHNQTTTSHPQVHHHLLRRVGSGGLSIC
eukprot:1148712-Pelagomonas_calceolata.AAC.5